MDKKTKTALEQSIKKWESNVKATDPYDIKMDARDCHLCLLFRADNTDNKQENMHVKRQDADCVGCPIAESAGEKYCHGTPYEAVYETFMNVCDGACNCVVGRDITKAELRLIWRRFRKAAQAEVDFLKSLLPAHSQDGEL